MVVVVVVVVVVVLCCAFEENDDSFQKYLLNPNRESKSKRSFGLSPLKRRVHTTFFLRHFFSELGRQKGKGQKKQLKSRSVFLSFQRYKRPVNDVNDGKQRERKRESVCV